MQTDVISDARGEVLRTPVVWFMALAAALGTASIYPLQPAIADVAGSLHASLATIGFALACGPLGYLLGLALLVPLVDRFAPRYVLSRSSAHWPPHWPSTLSSAPHGFSALLSVWSAPDRRSARN